MVTEFKLGKMVVFLWELGRMTKLMDMANFFMQMGMYIKEIGKVIRQMGLAFTNIWTELDMKGSGLTTYNMEKGENIHLTDAATSDILL